MRCWNRCCCCWAAWNPPVMPPVVDVVALDSKRLLGEAVPLVPLFTVGRGMLTALTPEVPAINGFKTLSVNSTIDACKRSCCCCKAARRVGARSGSESWVASVLMLDESWL